MTDPTPHAFEYPDEAGYPDGTGTLSEDQVVLIDELDDPHAPAFAITVVNDREAGVYEAVVGDRAIGGLTYDVVKGTDRVVLPRDIHLLRVPWPGHRDRADPSGAR